MESAQTYALTASIHDQEEDPQLDNNPQDDSGAAAYPEGGLEGWTCLLGSFILMFPSFGFQTAIGSVQDYISTHQLAHYSVHNVGWISALLVFLTLFLGVQVGPLFDHYSPRTLLMCRSAMSFTSYMLLAQCSEYWHFLLCLSICSSLASALITTVAIAVLSHWFFQLRALASGIALGGSSISGAIIPLLLQYLFPLYSWTWSIRAIAFIALACYLLGILLVKGHLPQNTSRLARRVIDFKAFTSARVAFLAMAVWSFKFIVFGGRALLPTYVHYAGFRLDVQFYSLTVLNSTSLLSHVIPGFTADHIGRFNVLLFLIILTLFIMVAVWLPVGSRDITTLYAVLASFGFGSGRWLSLSPVCAGQLCRTEEYSRFYGTVYSVAAFGVLLTVPVGGELLQSTTPQVLVGFYSAMLLGLAGILACRWALLGWRWQWKVKI